MRTKRTTTQPPFPPSRIHWTTPPTGSSDGLQNIEAEYRHARSTVRILIIVAFGMAVLTSLLTCVFTCMAP